MKDIRIENHCILVQSGDYKVYLTKTQINKMKMMLDGKIKDSFKSPTIPSNRFFKEGDNIIVTSELNRITITPKDIKSISSIRDNNRKYLIFDNEIYKRDYERYSYKKY